MLAQALVDAVLIGEGRDPNVVLKEERRPMLDIVARWAAYEGQKVSATSDRPHLPPDF